MSRRRTIEVLLCLVVALAIGLTAPSATPSQRVDPGDRFSAVPLHPQAVEKLKAAGRKLPSPFPNSANRGRKFNPTGDAIGPLVTARVQNVLVIFVKFSDDPPGGPATRLDLATYFDAMLFGTEYDPPEYAPYVGHPIDRTLRNYYSEVSYGGVDVVTLDMPSELGWAEVEQAYDYYCDGQYGFGWYPRNAAALVEDAVKAVDAVVDFRNYAVNGEVPNLFVVHAGTGAEWNGDPSLLWSHSWDLEYGAAGKFISNEGVVINNYALMPEVGGNTTGYYGGPTGPYPPTVGVFAHEYAHVLGLPDQYDYGNESNGTGPYSLMSYGSWNQWPVDDIFSGNSPAHLDAWSKYRLGFVTPVEIASATSGVLLPAETDPVVYKMVVPFSGGKEYFLFENRQNIGFDEGLLLYGGGYAHGLAIYHIDDGVLTRNYWRPNEAENWKEFRSEGWRKAWTGETHYGISIMQADGWWTLERGGWGNFASDLYPGYLGVTKFGNDTHPNSSNYYFWAGSAPKFGYSGVTVDKIQESGGIVSADFSFVPWTPKK